MTTAVWVLIEAAAVVGVVVAWPRRVRHYRWRNRRFLRRVHAIELRGRGGVGSEGGQAAPPGLPVSAGVERADAHPADAPPAPMPLAGAACPPAAAPARPHLVRLGGAW